MDKFWKLLVIITDKYFKQKLYNFKKNEVNYLFDFLILKISMKIKFKFIY